MQVVALSSPDAAFRALHPVQYPYAEIPPTHRSVFRTLLHQLTPTSGYSQRGVVMEGKAHSATIRLEGRKGLSRVTIAIPFVAKGYLDLPEVVDVEEAAMLAHAWVVQMMRERYSTPGIRYWFDPAPIAG